MEKVKLADTLELSRIVHGHWRLRDWNLSDQQLLQHIEEVRELGISSFDHADIYGNHTCEEKMGRALALQPSLRPQIQLITKCGIKLATDKFPDRKVKIYDFSYEHIIASAEQSLINFQTDYIDLLLLHRPSPFFNPEEVARAFSDLKQSGKVLHFGVSNFLPVQFEMLQSFLDERLVTNQLEISPLCLDAFENGNLDFMLQQKISPMAWSPLGGGKLFNPKSEKEIRIHNCLTEIAEELSCSIGTVIYAWLLKHPSKIIPVSGSGKIERIKVAVDALPLKMNLEQWFRIYIAGKGEELP